MLGRSDVAEKVGAVGGSERPADRRGDMIIAWRHIGDYRSQDIKGRTVAEFLLQLHVGYHFVERYMPGPSIITWTSACQHRLVSSPKMINS